MGKKTRWGWALPALWCLQYALGCGAGSIVEDCESTCSPASLTQCVDGKIRSCLPDARGCLAWGAVIPCETGICADNEQCTGCDNSCSAGGKTECTDGKVRTCVANALGCLDWSAAVECPFGTCLDAKSCGNCIPDCKGRQCGRDPICDRESCGVCPESAPICNNDGRCVGNPGSVIFVGDFETGDVSQWTYHNTCFPGRLRFVTTPVRSGKYAAEFTVKPGDVCNSPNNERMEVAVQTPTIPNEKEGDDYYYGWSTFFPESFVVPSSYWGLFMQINNPVGSPNVALRVDSSSTPTGMGIFVQMNTGDMVTPKPFTLSKRVLPLTRNVWNDFVVRVKWSFSDGIFEVWHKLATNTEYVKVFEISGVPTLKIQPADNPFGDKLLKSCGLYRNAQDVTQTLVHDNYIIATTFPEAAARVMEKNE